MGVLMIRLYHHCITVYVQISIALVSHMQYVSECKVLTRERAHCEESGDVRVSAEHFEYVNLFGHTACSTVDFDRENAQLFDCRAGYVHLFLILGVLGGLTRVSDDDSQHMITSYIVYEL